MKKRITSGLLMICMALVIVCSNVSLSNNNAGSHDNEVAPMRAEFTGELVI